MSRSARLALLGLAWPALLSAQERDRCTLQPVAEGLVRVRTPSGQYNTFIGRGVDVICPTKDLRVRADSLESYGDDGRLYLVGNVRYNEPRLNLTSSFLTYHQREERILATGNVDARLPNGSTLRGPVAEYLRAIPGVRPVPRLHASGRPTVTIAERDTARPTTAPPTTVNANNITMIGDSLVFAGGQVVVTREDVIARGDSMDLDSEREITVLMRGPSIEGRRDRPYTLRGQRIELTGSNRKLRRVIAMAFASATSEDMVLASDTIELRVEADLLQRAIAWGPSRAKAASAQQRIESDSIDVLLPNQRLREMHAVRNAVAEGRPDSSRFRADTLDWLRGDTIIARFDTTTANDTTRQARLRELVSRGRARSYHHMAAADSSVRRAAINYVIGREIIVAFDQQRVGKVTVLDRAAGVYLEPTLARAAPDTTRTMPAATPAPNPSTARPSAGRPRPPG